MGATALGLSAPSAGVGTTEGGLYFIVNGSYGALSSQHTVYLYSSNPDVVKVPNSVSVGTGQASTLLSLDYIGVGSSTITVVSPGLTTAEASITVLASATPTIVYSGLTTIREGETYPFAISFVVGTTPLNMSGVVDVFSQSITTNADVYTVSGGIVFGRLSGQSSGNSSLTMVSSYMAGVVVPIGVVVVPLLALQTYQVSVVSSSTPLAGVPVEFTYGNTTTSVSTNSEGQASFQAVNSTATIASVPMSMIIGGSTYYFQNWSNGVTSAQVNLLSSVKLVADYERVQSLNYTIDVTLSTGGPVSNATAVLRINNVNSTLKSTTGVISFTELSNVKGTVTFPQVIPVTNNERYALVSVDNATSPAVSLSGKNITAVYSLQYFIAVFTEHGAVTGTGWYTVGSTDNVVLNETSVSTGLLTYLRFAGWHGGATTSQKPTTQIVVTGAEVVSAIWIQDNILLYAAFTGAAAVGGIIGFMMLRRYSQSPKTASIDETTPEEGSDDTVSDTL